MSGVPSNIIIPFVGVDFETVASTGASVFPLQGLLIGQKITAGTGTAEVKYLVSSADEVATLGGRGSQIHQLAIAYFANNATVPCKIIMLADGAGTKSTQVVTLTGTATAAGEIALYFNGTRIAAAVSVGDGFAVVGAALAAAATAEADLSHTAAYLSGDVTFTARNAGLAAGDVDCRLSFNAGETIPAGLTCVVGAFVAGATDPDVQDAIDAIGDEWFQIVAHAYSDATNIGKIQAYEATQFGVMVQRGAVWISPKRDTRANLITLGQTTATYNSKHVCMPAWYKRLESTTTGAGAIAGAILESLNGDVGQPLHRLAVAGITALATNERWTNIERNQVAVAGIATLSDANGVQLETPITMYLKNSAGAADASYQLIGNVIKLLYARYDFVNGLLATYPNARESDSSDNMKPGLQVMTPKIGLGYALVWFKRMEFEGILEGYSAFKALVTCKRSTVNSDRMEWSLPSDLVNAFMVGSGTIKFKL